MYNFVISDKINTLKGKEDFAMKRFVVVLAGLLTLPAFAVDTSVRRDAAARSDAISRNVDTPVVSVAGRGARRAVVTTNRSGAVRVAPSATADDMTIANRNAASGRVIAAGRSGVAAPSVSARAGVARDVRSVSGRDTGVSSAAGAVSSRVRARAATVSANVSKTDKGISVKNSSAATAEVAAAPASTTAAMESLASLTAFCKAQYTECMDNFCNVLDDNQGRCSCSKNVKNYEKTEEALKTATEALQDVAQQIQYIGLTRDEIETLFTQTEAELQMQATSDNSQLKNDLDKIKGMIVQVKSGTASSNELNTGLSMDLSGLMDFNISSTGFDLGALFGTQTSNTNSISNQRGEQLYKTAAARCRVAILNECQSQGVDISIVSNAYDMEIDKQCVAYERSLTDANDEMNQTVRNAKSVLQRARLMVAQQKNAYDLRGCVNALDSCMQDDFVCGNDYENCLDATGKYIVNGEVVLGSTPGQAVTTGTQICTGSQTTNCLQAGGVYSTDGLYSVWNYDTNKNAWAETTNGGDLSDFIAKTVTSSNPTTAGNTMSSYLQYKIGYIDDNKVHGMCASILNKCQDYSYEGGDYKPDNRVVKEYLTRTMVKIKNAQDAILNNYGETCISDVSSCLSENNYDPKSSSNKSNVAINACRSKIVTCMSVNGDAAATPSPDVISSWVQSVMPSSTTE